ncbi:RNA 2',3'-cyclic phosphodiesterase [Longimycelium tulufanense]|uniref:RNA 2',3'-cyclic phosphodiesterase n=1 Tax=Longimycelium tulufanense TaxID=907463 RepID=A0A8J3FSQ4_9PSEU|nr:RNA 2',3'-cyclic phosphodiesterase [Longimycelium tulufanense]GGM38414.1 RNA 2',3'-cyclic phosphodiesterase [Longimycelium tulufanense]
MRLFTALWPPEDAVRDLTARLRAALAQPPAGLRWVPVEKWHLTLCFHGECDDAERDRRADRLRRRGPKVLGPTLRFTGSGVFRGVLWVGVEPREEADVAALRQLAKVAGTDPGRYRPHLTVARWSRGRPDTTAIRELLADYTGPWWVADEVLLVRSELHGAQGSTYSRLERVPLQRESP